MKLDLINTFDKPFKVYEYKKLSFEEASEYYNKHKKLPENPFPSKFLYSVSSHKQAAEHIVKKVIDNRLEHHIDMHLKSSQTFKTWLEKMPLPTEQIKKQKTSHTHCDDAKLNEEMNSLNYSLSDGQMLFHAGILLNEGEEIKTLERPLATSFCPQVALRNSEHRGKALRDGKIELYVIKVVNSDNKIYSYDPESDDDTCSYEKEVLFSSGLLIKLISRTQVRDDYKISENKFIPVFVVEVEVS